MVSDPVPTLDGAALREIFVVRARDLMAGPRTNSEGPALVIAGLFDLVPDIYGQVQLAF